jgi:hypothetical protein
MMEDEARLGALRVRCLALREILRGPGPTAAVVDMLGKEAAGAWS